MANKINFGDSSGILSHIGQLGDQTSLKRENLRTSSEANSITIDLGG